MTIKEANELRAGDKVLWEDPDENRCTKIFLVWKIRVNEADISITLTDPYGGVLSCPLDELTLVKPPESVTNERLVEAINQVVEYNWNDELEDYADNPESREGHIFTFLVTLANFIDGTFKSPEEHLAEFYANRRPASLKQA